MREARYTKAEGQAEQLDEVVADDVSQFHLEQLDNGHWWIGIDHTDGTTTHINLFTKRRTTQVSGRCEFDV